MACRSERAGERAKGGYRTYGSGGGGWRGGGSGRNRASGCSLVPAGRHRAAVLCIGACRKLPGYLGRAVPFGCAYSRWRLSRSNRASVGSSRRSAARRCTHAEDRSCDRIWVSHSHGKAAILDKRCGLVPLRASAGPGQCRACRASAVPRRCWSTGACCRVPRRHVQRWLRHAVRRTTRNSRSCNMSELMASATPCPVSSCSPRSRAAVAASLAPTPCFCQPPPHPLGTRY
jgi:hypothetical protein